MTDVQLADLLDQCKFIGERATAVSVPVELAKQITQALRSHAAQGAVWEAQDDDVAFLQKWIEMCGNTAQALRMEGIVKRLQAASTPAVPEGWKLVPQEPTKTMLALGTKAADEKLAALRGYDQNGTGLDGMNFCVREAFKAMVAAAPQEPK